MVENPEAGAKTILAGAEDAASDMFEVFADYIAPLVGLAVGWALGQVLGGAATVGELVYGIASKGTTAQQATKIADIIGGSVMGGVSVIAGGLFWSASDKYKAKKKVGSMIVRSLLRLGSGIGFGMGIAYVVDGFTGNVQDGWIESLASGITKEV